MNQQIKIGNSVSKLSLFEPLPPVSKVRVFWDEENAFEAGDNSGYTIDVFCPWGTQEMAAEILAAGKGYQYKAYEAADAQLPVNAELGDGLSLSSVYGLLADKDLEIGAGNLSRVKAPGENEIDHEYPYLTKTEREMLRKVTLGADYYGTRITRKNGLEIIKTDGETEKSRVILNSDLLAFYDDDGKEALYFDTAAGTYKFQGTINVADNFIVDAKGNVTLNGNIQWGTGNAPLTEIEYDDITGALKTSGDGIYYFGGSIHINASYIDAGTLLADYIKLYGDMTVYRTRSGATSGGLLGYASSTLDGSGGIHMYSSGSEVRATSSGAALEGSSGGRVVCTANVSMTGDYIFFNAGDGCEMTANRFNPLSDWGMDLGMSGQRWGTVYAGGGVVTTSDKAAKKDIVYGLDKYDVLFDELKPCSFRMNHKKADERIRTGLIVQDIDEVLPVVGLTRDDFAGLHMSEKEGESGLDYTQFIALLIDQVQKLKKRVKALEDKE